MRPKLEEEDSEITKMSYPMLNYYQDAEAHIDKMEARMSVIISNNKIKTSKRRLIQDKLVEAKQQIKVLKLYVKHTMNCSWLNNGNGNCDCGLKQALK